MGVQDFNETQLDIENVPDSFHESQALEAGGDFQSRLIKHSVGRLVLLGGNAES